MLPWVSARVRDVPLIFDLTFGSTLHPLIPYPLPLSPFPPLAPQIRGAEMRSFWTESQKKKEKNNFSFLFYFLI